MRVSLFLLALLCSLLGESFTNTKFFPEGFDTLSTKSAVHIVPDRSMKILYSSWKMELLYKEKIASLEEAIFSFSNLTNSMAMSISLERDRVTSLTHKFDDLHAKDRKGFIIGVSVGSAGSILLIMAASYILNSVNGRN